MRQFLDIEKLESYSYKKESRFQVTFRVLDIQTGDFKYKTGIEVTSKNALNAATNALSSILEKQDIRSVELDSVQYLSSVEDYIKELERFRYD